MKLTEQALKASKKAKHNLYTITLDYFNIIAKAELRINDLEEEIKQLKYKIELTERR